MVGELLNLCYEHETLLRDPVNWTRKAVAWAKGKTYDVPRLRPNVSTSWKIMSTARGIMPRSSPLCVWPCAAGGPDMVYVLPLPVCPYAKMHTWKPSSELCTSALISANTSPCEC